MASLPVHVGRRRGLLTTDHAASSHGLPVVVLDGQAHGPAELAEPVVVPRLEDLRPVRYLFAARLVDAARAAGYRIAERGAPERASFACPACAAHLRPRATFCMRCGWTRDADPLHWWAAR